MNKQEFEVQISAATSSEAAARASALIIAVLPLWDDRGDAIHTREVAQALGARGIATNVLCLHGTSHPANEIACTTVEVKPLRRRGLFQLSWNVLATIAAVRTIRRNKITVIYSRLDPGMIVGWLASVLTGTPLIVEMNGLPSEDMRLFRPKARVQFAITRLWENFMYRVADRIVGAPGYINYVTQVFGISADKWRRVPLGVNTQLFSPGEKETARHELMLPARPTIVWMGNITVWQGLETLIRSMTYVAKTVRQAHLVIVGDGVLYGDCCRLTEELGLDGYVSFIGHVEYARVPMYLRAADVCVSSFPGARGIKGSISALKTVSYLATGRPVVTTWMDELGETITADGAGFCVPPDQPAVMGDRIAALLSESEDVVAARCAAALSLVSAGRSWSDTSRVIIQCMEEVSG